MIYKKLLVTFSVIFLMTSFFQKTYGQCYELVWSEEFDYTGYPDPDIWNMEVGNNNGWGNSEKQYYTKNDKDNCWVDSGRMTITAVKEPLNGFEYTSARLTTKDKAEFKYGKIEARLRLPYGQGIWPAFWMLGENISEVGWPACGEIDIMEMVGGVDPRDRTTHGTAHWSNASNNRASYGGSKALPSGKFADDFHLFSIEWTSQSIRWFLDGVQFWIINTVPDDLNEFRNDHFIILNLAVGGVWPGYPDATTVFPQKFEIDYVRVYQQASDLSIEGKDSLVAKEKGVSYSLPAAEGREFLWSVPEGASLITRADSNAVVVDWGCSPGEVACSITTACSTSIVKKKNVSLAGLAIEGPVFHDKVAGNLFFSVPVMSETDYLWTLPADASFVTGETSNAAEVSWGEEPGMISLQLTNTCGTTNLSKNLFSYGQYPYPNPEEPFVIPGTLNSTDYDFGGEGVAYHDSGMGNQGTGDRRDEGVDTQNQALFPNVGWIVSGEWLEYSIKVPEAGYYRIEMKVATQNTTNIGPLKVLVNGESRIADITVPPTGAWTTFVTVSQRLLYLNTTDTLLRIEVGKGGFNLGPIKFVVDNSVSVLDLESGSGQLRVFPNPVKDILNIKFHMSKPGDVDVKICDLSGKQLIHSVSKGIGSGDQRIALSDELKTLKAGIYLIEITTNDQTYFSKFLKD